MFKPGHDSTLLSALVPAVRNNAPGVYGLIDFPGGETLDERIVSAASLMASAGFSEALIGKMDKRSRGEAAAKAPARTTRPPKSGTLLGVPSPGYSTPLPVKKPAGQIPAGDYIQIGTWRKPAHYKEEFPDHVFYHDSMGHEHKVPKSNVTIVTH